LRHLRCFPTRRSSDRVENIELLSRYGSDAAEATLDKLGGGAWQARKARLKKRLLDMAGQLIRIAAERQMRAAPVMVPQAGLDGRSEEHTSELQSRENL